MYTETLAAVQDHSDPDQASHTDYLDLVENEIETQKILEHYASFAD